MIFNVNGDSLPGPLIIGTFEKRAQAPVVQTLDSVIHQAPVAQKLDSAIHRINHYPLDKYYEN